MNHLLDIGIQFIRNIWHLSTHIHIHPVSLTPNPNRFSTPNPNHPHILYPFPILWKLAFSSSSLPPSIPATTKLRDFSAPSQSIRACANAPPLALKIRAPRVVLLQQPRYQDLLNRWSLTRELIGEIYTRRLPPMRGRVAISVIWDVWARARGLMFFMRGREREKFNGRSFFIAVMFDVMYMRPARRNDHIFLLVEGRGM